MTPKALSERAGRLAPMALPRQSIQGTCFSSHGMPRIRSYLSISRKMNCSVLSKSSNLTNRSIRTLGTTNNDPLVSLAETGPAPDFSLRASANLSAFLATD
ncbi:unnamed protein product [Phytophthora fragariaefolia]|uniref:Unnamed protein product n=1 Tax=Phytophthora fragariaefolia TaxID=1490495 RepID=A0A9W6WRB4_9STRA|nr:unnamed protein product [Phytophthora fragariaefolia]